MVYEDKIPEESWLGRQKRVICSPSAPRGFHESTLIREDPPPKTKSAFFYIVNISTFLKNIIIDKDNLENIDIDKAILENIDIDKDSWKNIYQYQ